MLVKKAEVRDAAKKNRIANTQTQKIKALEEANKAKALKIIKTSTPIRGIIPATPKPVNIIQTVTKNKQRKNNLQLPK